MGALLGGSAGLVAGCTRERPAPVASATPSDAVVEELMELEERSGRTIAAVTRQGEDVLVAHRPDEPMPMCSVFKTFLVGALLAERGDDRDWWDTASIEVSADDVVPGSTVHDEPTGPQSPHALAEATLRWSDNTAANLLLAELGGPAALTAAVQDLGAAATRLDRTEPDLNEAAPGDPRDTSTAAETAMLMHALLVERRAGAYPAARLGTWMLWNETSRVTDALSDGDELADRTGGGGYGVVNDAGVLYRPGEEPLAFAIMTRTDDADAENDGSVVLDAARVLLGA